MSQSRSTCSILGKLGVSVGGGAVIGALAGVSTDMFVNAHNDEDQSRDDWQALIAFGVTTVVSAGMIFALLLRRANSTVNNYAPVPTEDPDSDSRNETDVEAQVPVQVSATVPSAPTSALSAPTPVPSASHAVSTPIQIKNKSPNQAVAESPYWAGQGLGANAAYRNTKLVNREPTKNDDNQDNLFRCSPQNN